jgi:hypothetical protein
MKPRPFHARCCCCLFLITVALMIKPEGARAERASLRIEISSHGVAAVHFILATLPRKPEALGPLISEALGLKFGETALEVEEGKKVVTFDASSRDAFPHRMLRVNGRIDLAPLERFLRDLGIDSMMVEIVHPRGAFSYCSVATRNSGSRGPTVDYEYVAAIASRQSPNSSLDSAIAPAICFVRSFSYRASGCCWLARRHGESKQRPPGWLPVTRRHR